MIYYLQKRDLVNNWYKDKFWYLRLAWSRLVPTARANEPKSGWEFRLTCDIGSWTVPQKVTVLYINSCSQRQCLEALEAFLCSWCFSSSRIIDFLLKQSHEQRATDWLHPPLLPSLPKKYKRKVPWVLEVGSWSRSVAESKMAFRLLDFGKPIRSPFTGREICFGFFLCLCRMSSRSMCNWQDEAH